MDFSPVILAIPLFFALMALELVYEWFARKKTYRLNDAVTNISTGTLQQLSGTFLRIFNIGIYVFIFEKWSFFQLEASWLTFILLFVLYDLCYYWEHRIAHEISLFWGGHVVHHQSEEFNLSVALRQSSTSIIWGFPFFLPLALLGFDPTQFALVAGLNLLYQFWIHTEHINKMGWFESIFNTPSHHRVHHGRDPKYIDKNYAGVFIVWDRWFGTFQAEEERPTYGITTPLSSWNPVYANFAHYVALFRQVRQSRSVKDGFKILFNRPGWLPDYLGGYQPPYTPEPDFQKYDRSLPSRSLHLYVFFQFLIALGAYSYFFFQQGSFSGIQTIIYALWIVYTTLLFGFIFETGKGWVLAGEILRLGMIPVGMYFMGGFPGWLLIFAGGYVSFSILFLLPIYSRQMLPTGTLRGQMQENK